MRSPILDVNVHFRVSGIAINNRTACGGVLFVNDSEVRALFSGPTYGSSRFSAGLYAVIVAIDIFKSSGWATLVPLVICLDCKIIINWLENPLQFSWGLSKEIADIKCQLCSLFDCRFISIDREGNVMASSLAFEGLYKESCFKAWW
ncbi:hypothetical protein V6N13_041654 [Hibiscus sabdariffa]